MDLSQKTAVLVLNHNGKEFLARCLSSLQKQTSTDFDTFLVDNGSDDGSIELTRRIFDRVNIIDVKENLGFTGGYNFAFEFLENHETTYDLYLLINNDTILDKKLIEEIVNIFNQSEEIGVVVPTIITEDFLIDSCGGRFFFPTGTPLGYLHGQEYIRKDIRFRCFWGSGCTFAIRRDLLTRIGYFENYLFYFEDIDLSWRVNNSNYNVISTLNTYVIHFGSKSMKSSPFSHYLCERNRMLSYWQNLSLPTFLAAVPMLTTGRILLLFRSLSLKEIAAKIRGLFSGLLVIPKYNRHNSSFKQDLATIRTMYKISVYNVGECEKQNKIIKNK